MIVSHRIMTAATRTVTVAQKRLGRGAAIASRPLFRAHDPLIWIAPSETGADDDDLEQRFWHPAGQSRADTALHFSQSFETAIANRNDDILEV